MSAAVRPLAIGALMGLMMLWMLHGRLTSGEAGFDLALILFGGAHVLMALAAGTVAVIAARLSPRLRAGLARVHRPAVGHVGLMLSGAAGAAMLAHLVLHHGVLG